MFVKSILVLATAALAIAAPAPDKKKCNKTPQLPHNDDFRKSQ